MAAFAAKNIILILYQIEKTRQKALYRCGKGPQNPQDFKKCDLLILLKKIDLEMLPHLKIS